MPRWLKDKLRVFLKFQFLGYRETPKGRRAVFAWMFAGRPRIRWLFDRADLEQLIRLLQRFDIDPEMERRALEGWELGDEVQEGR
jgi:hypothetical protein